MNKQYQEDTVQTLDKFLREALVAQQNYIKKISLVAQHIGVRQQELGEESTKRLYQLLLQHRLDKENVIKNLMRANKALCLALGLEEHASLSKNLDAAAKQLGKDNLFRELALLRHLVEKLAKMLALLERTKKIQLQEKEQLAKLFKKNKNNAQGEVNGESDKEAHGKARAASHSYQERIASHGDSIVHELKTAIGLQAYFSYCIEQLTEALQVLPGLPKFGIIYDYLAGIKGPVSNFQTLLLQGISYTNEALQTLANRLQLKSEPSMTQLIHHLNASLDNLNSTQMLLQHEHVQYKHLLHQLEENSAPPSLQPELKNEPVWKRRTFELFNRS